MLSKQPVRGIHGMVAGVHNLAAQFSDGCLLRT